MPLARELTGIPDDRDWAFLLSLGYRPTGRSRRSGIPGGGRSPKSCTASVGKPHASQPHLALGQGPSHDSADPEPQPRRRLITHAPQSCQNWQMRLTDRLSQPQKIVVVIALGMAFGAAGIYLAGIGNTAGFGWYAYPPLSRASFVPRTGPAGWLRLVTWLALTGLWALLSVRVLRPTPQEPPG